jgi:hypothetical protein
VEVLSLFVARPRFQGKKLRMMRGAVHCKLCGDGKIIGEGALK